MTASQLSLTVKSGPAYDVIVMGGGVSGSATATGLMVCFAFVTGASAPLLLGYLKQSMGLDHAFVWLAPSFFACGLLIAFAPLSFFKTDHAAALSDL